LIERKRKEKKRKKIRERESKAFINNKITLIFINIE